MAKIEVYGEDNFMDKEGIGMLRWGNIFITENGKRVEAGGVRFMNFNKLVLFKNHDIEEEKLGRDRTIVIANDNHEMGMIATMYCKIDSKNEKAILDNFFEEKSKKYPQRFEIREVGSY